jgi:porphobilinogen synthase
MRRLTAETRIHAAELILPLFVREGTPEPLPLQSMPGVLQHSIDSLKRAVTDAAPPARAQSVNRASAPHARPPR